MIVSCKNCRNKQEHSEDFFECERCGGIDMNIGEGKKFDNDKLRWDLLPIEPIEEMVYILTMGCNKYGANNWQNVEAYRYDAALMRHYSAWKKGEKKDEESNKSHLAHMLCNIVFLLYKELYGLKINSIESD